MEVTVSRKAHFNAAHRLHNPNWSQSKNSEVFGKCNNPNFHGHNYELIVSVKGPVDPQTGYVIDMKFLSELIKDQIEEKLDHKNLNLDIDYFKKVNPTAENIVVWIWNQLRSLIDEKLHISVVLYETERNFVSFDGNY